MVFTRPPICGAGSIFDLPGADRVIRSIELRYKNVPGGGNAKVQIWAR